MFQVLWNADLPYLQAKERACHVMKWEVMDLASDRFLVVVPSEGDS